MRPILLACSLYFSVCAFLLLRLFLGLVQAVRLWREAEPALLDDWQEFIPEHRLRTSNGVSSPVTIGSGVLLPADFASWDAEKLRIVLAHEHSHVRQGDFYLQLLAGVHAALFWFSPLGWWLKRKLSDLGEAISDHAGLQQAASRTSYAQILLEFAVSPRPTLLGVAMARPSNLSHRIERLLNESIFHKAFATSRRRALLAVLLVPTALFAATALIRVEAAGQTQPQSSQVPSSLTGQSHPDDASPAVPNAAEPPAAAPQSESPAPAPPPVPAVISDRAPEMPRPLQAPESPGRVSVHNGTSFRWSSNGDSYAVITGPGDSVNFSGSWNKTINEQIEKARKLAGGKFLWFTHDGKSFIVDDPAVAARIQEMYKPMEALGAQQAALGKEQEEFGRQQEKLERELEKASLPTPDMTKEMAELDAAMATLKTSKLANMTPEQWADFQSKMGNLQGKLGEIQGKIGESQGKWGELQGKLGEQQGKLGEKQGRLGEEEGRIAQEADRKVRSIIDESLKNGKAHPVD